MKKRMTLFSAACILFSGFAAPAAGSANTQLDYVALGDSIAAGQTPYGATIGTSYTDLIAQSFQSKGVLASFSKQYALSGETSSQFLAKLDQAAVQRDIKAAELVTISTGANDLIQLVRSGALTQVKAMEMLTQIDRNLQAGITKIKALNPQTKIYVFGYYFPFPHMQESAQKENLKLAFTFFNDQLKASATAKGAAFVDVSQLFAANPSYLPNPSDIHPSVAGYQAMANQFLSAFPVSPVLPLPVVDGPGTAPPETTPLPPVPGTTPAPSPLPNTPVPGTPSGDPFSDIGTIGSKARTAIMELSKANVINGKADGTFAPKSNITRAEAAIILARVLGQTGSAPNPGFSDVSSNMKSYQAIAKLTEIGIFAKTSKFNPDKLLTRAQMARLLSQALELQVKSSASFSDVSSKHWAKKEIDAVYSHNIMTGGSEGRFYPDSNITREQFALTIYNAKSQVPAGVR